MIPIRIYKNNEYKGIIFCEHYKYESFAYVICDLEDRIISFMEGEMIGYGNTIRIEV